MSARPQGVHSEDLHSQRQLDGRLSPGEAAAVDAALARDAARADEASRMRVLHAELSAALRPLDLDTHHALLTRFAQALPQGAPQPSRRLRTADLVLGVALLCMVGLCFGATGSIAHGTIAAMAIASMGLIGGMLLLLIATMLVRNNNGLLSKLLGRKLVIGPADVLLCRAIGLGMVIGGIYLAHLH